MLTNTKIISGWDKNVRFHYQENDVSDSLQDARQIFQNQNAGNIGQLIDGTGIPRYNPVFNSCVDKKSL